MTNYDTREEALAPDSIKEALPHAGRCPMATTKAGELEPCDKPTTVLTAHEWDGSWWLDPMCVWHSYQNGGQRNSVPLLALIDHLKETS